MKRNSTPFDRRKFLQSGALLAVTAATAGLLSFAKRPGTYPFTPNEELYMIVPTEGYSPYIGSLVGNLTVKLIQEDDFYCKSDRYSGFMAK